MTARIARGSAQRARPRNTAPARGRQGQRKAAPQSQGLADAIRRLSWWIFIGMLIALAVALLAVFQIPQLAGTALGETVGRAGFVAKRVETRGLVRMSPMQVNWIASAQLDRAMPLVDLEAIRQQLLKFGWVRDARVSRRLPDTLVVDIVERRPAAIWQHNRQLALIDVDGVVLEAVRDQAMPDLPLIIGPAANMHAAELGRLVDSAPRLKPAMANASWVGGRRWDIGFQSGETLALPEGEEAATRALARFARMDQTTQLLGRGYARFDMRIRGKMYVRLSNQPGSTVPALVPPAPALQPPPPPPVSAPADVDPATTI